MNARTFRAAAAALPRLCRFQLRNLLSTAFFLQTALATPLSFALLRIIAGRGSVDPAVWFDAAVSGLWATTTLATGIIGFQRFQGVLQYLAISPLPAWAVFLPVVAAATLVGLVGLPVAVVATLSFALAHGGLAVAVSVAPAQLFGYLMAVVACCASAAALSCVFVLSRHAIAFEPLILIPVWLLCGIVAPVSGFPTAVRWLTHLHPLTFAVDIARHSLSAPVTTLQVGACLLLSAGYVAASAVGLRVALRRARVEGRLDLA